MIECRFVGGEISEIGELEFDTVGQKAMFSEEGFREVILGGAAFIPERDFKNVSFTDSELREFAKYGDRIDPTPDFVEKLTRAQDIYRDLRNRMMTEPISMILADICQDETVLA